MSPLETIIRTYAWVVGPLYDRTVSDRSIGYRAVRGWNGINLDDVAEEAHTVRATTPEELLGLVEAFEADANRKRDEAKAKLEGTP